MSEPIPLFKNTRGEKKLQKFPPDFIADLPTTANPTLLLQLLAATTKMVKGSPKEGELQKLLESLDLELENNLKESADLESNLNLDDFTPNTGTTSRLSAIDQQEITSGVYLHQN